MELNEITYKVRGAIFEVYNHLGPGLLESVYEAALMQARAETCWFTRKQSSCFTCKL